MGQQAVKFAIPSNIAFEDLRLTRENDGSIAFDIGVIERICEASNVSSELLLKQHEDVVTGFLAKWYSVHRAHGGQPDPVMEDLIAEAKIEDQAGQHFSLKPGQA